MISCKILFQIHNITSVFFLTKYLKLTLSYVVKLKSSNLQKKLFFNSFDFKSLTPSATLKKTQLVVPQSLMHKPVKNVQIIKY